MSYRLIVTGSRDWHDRMLLEMVLDELLADAGGTLTLVHGAARRGADAMAQTWALNRNARSSYGPVIIETHPAEWGKYGRAAGFRRNEFMVSLGADLCLAFCLSCTKAACSDFAPHPTHGTQHCIRKARQAAIPVRKIEVNNA